MEARILNTVSRYAFPAFAGIALLQSSLYDVRGGSRAVIFDRLSGVKEQVVSEGTHFLVPWLQRAITFDVRTKPRNIATTTGSKDLQMVSLTLRVLHRPEVQALPKIYQVSFLLCNFREVDSDPEAKFAAEPRYRLRRESPALYWKRSVEVYCRTVRCRRADYAA